MLHGLFCRRMVVGALVPVAGMTDRPGVRYVSGVGFREAFALLRGGFPFFLRVMPAFSVLS